MASTGRRPLPPNVRRLNGLPDRPTATPVVVPVEAPTDLPAAALLVWDRLALRLSERGVLDQLSVNLLRRYCWAAAKWDELSARLDDEGSTVPGARGEQSVRLPLWTPWRAVSDEMSRLERHLGLSPADRDRVPQSEPEASGLDPARLLT